jgi:hypothetical protein
MERQCFAKERLSRSDASIESKQRFHGLAVFVDLPIQIRLL